MTNKHITIVGSGVNGLTTGIVLREAGWDVTIWTAAPAQQTTSMIAAAIWYPYKAYPEVDVLRWGSTAFNAFVDLVQDVRSGVIMRDGVEIWPGPCPRPMVDERRAERRALQCNRPATRLQDGFTFRVPVIDMPVYLTYLQERFTHAGGNIEVRRIRSLDEATAPGSTTINCAGLEARELIGDTTLVPIRGQVVWVTNPGIERFVLDEADPDKATYIVPRISDIVLGGTADEGAWDTTPNPRAAEDILRRCTCLEPRLRDAQIIGHRVGLRPGRPAIRLEREARAGRQDHHP